MINKQGNGWCDGCGCDLGAGGEIFGENENLFLCIHCIDKLFWNNIEDIKDIHEHTHSDIVIESKVIIKRTILTEEQRDKIFKKYNNKCAKCGSDENLQIDHIKPWVRGGLTQEENLQTLCKKCNFEKGVKLI